MTTDTRREIARRSNRRRREKAQAEASTDTFFRTIHHHVLALSVRTCPLRRSRARPTFRRRPSRHTEKCELFVRRGRGDEEWNFQ